MPAHWVATTELPLAGLARFPGNPRLGDTAEIRKSIRRHGQYRAIVVRRHDGQHTILAGNHTADALAAEGMTTARCELIECTDDEARRINLADNRLAELGGYDDQALAELLARLDGDLDGTGWDIRDLDEIADALGRDDEAAGGTGDDPVPERPSLADRFLIPPFDVLDARQGWWRTRKRQWLSLGFQSELGRLDGKQDGRSVFAHSGHARADPKYYDKKRAAEAQAGHEMTAAEFEAGFYTPPAEGVSSGISIFDPVLCELAYRWFCPPGGAVLDPFAGGSVRGLTAAVLGRAYHGNDLSARQVEANQAQAAGFTARGLIHEDPVWTQGDSADWVTTLEPESADMIFTCPPYYDLERYSDHAADLSAMSTAAFDEAYARIIAGAASALRPGRFAVIVTGDARGGNGLLRDLRGATVTAASRAGLRYCSGAVLVTPLGSLPVVTARAFSGTRTLSRTHQDVLVFCKGDRKQAALACGDVDIELPDTILGAFADDPRAAQGQA